MKRGEIWTVSDTGYTGKHRPAIVLQSDDFPAIDSITVCGMTTDETAASLVRIVIMPDAENGLRQPSSAMVDKISTVRLAKVGRRVGRINAGQMLEIDRLIRRFLQLDH